MNAKRILALVLGMLMVVPMVLSVGAYSPAYTEIQDNTLNDSKLTISGNNLNFDLFGGVACTPGTKTCTYNITDESGALHLNNTSTTANQAYNTGNKGKANTTSAYSQFASTTEGMTFDLYAKFANLPKLASGMTDTGVVSGNPNNLYFSGLVFNLCSSEYYMADTSKSNNELQAVFAYYDNATLGTNTVLILPYGNRNAFASASAVVYYFNSSKTSYDRYTLSFDPAAKTTQFFINGVAQKANGNGSTTFNQVALCYRASATVNFLNINLNNAQGCVSANNGTYKADVYIDQLNVYPDALIPDPYTPARFEGDPATVKPSSDQLDKAIKFYNDFASYATDTINPTFWNAFKGWIDYCNNIVETGTQAQLDAACTGTSGNWFMNRMTWLSTAGAEATTGGSEVTVAGTGTVLPANTRIVTGTDRIWISHSAYNGRLDAYGLNNASVLLTRSGMRMSEYAAYDLSYCMALSTQWRAYVCEPTTAAGVYKVIEMGFNKDATVPEDGFILAFHADGVANGSVGSSGFASVLFGDRNERAIKASGIAVGDLVRLEGVTIHADKAATLNTTGTWYCLDDPRITTPTEITRNENGQNEYFNGFKSNAYMIEVDPATVEPDGAISVKAEGNGTVSAVAGGVTVSNPASFTTAHGATVTLKAEGENFSYWKNAKNDAVLSTSEEFSFIFGVSPLEIVAVFASTNDTTPTHTVTFKDSVTGKILGTASVESGKTVPADAIPSVVAPYGYIYRGFFAGVGETDSIDTYKITTNTVFYARYKSNDAAFFNLTIKDGEEEQVLRVRYAKTVVVNATSADFTNWNLNDEFYSSKKKVQLSMPNEDCTLSTVNNGSATVEPSIRFISNFVDENGSLMSTFARDIPAGYELIESGILLSRKAGSEDLVVDTINRTVTRGISTAPVSNDVFGFVKADIVSKAGIWLVRGYICVKSGDTVTTYYTDIDNVTVEGENVAERKASFVAMTHNVKNDDTLFADMAAHAAEENADVIGFQEVVAIDALSEAMQEKGYEVFAGQPRGTDFILLSANEYNPIYFKTSRFIKHNGGTFWLSETPDVKSKLSGLRHYRICTWVVLEDRETGKMIQYFNTHLCATANSEGLGSSADINDYRFQQVKILLTQIEYIAQNCPSGVRNILVGGDFNMTDTSGVFKYMTGAAAYSGEQNTITGSRLRFTRDIADTLVPNDQGNYYTMLEDGVAKYAFDHVLVDIGGFDVTEFSVCSNSVGSDHLPVCVTVREK